MHSLEELLEKLESLVKHGYEIILYCIEKKVVIQNRKNKHWTGFEGTNLKEAIARAISKLEHPEKDYIDERGMLWKANESSIYSEEHIKTFLREGEVDGD